MILKLIAPLALLALLISCEDADVDANVHQADWSDKVVSSDLYQHAESWYTYLPIYSRVYSSSNSETRAVTATVSIHNMNLKDSIFIMQADYFNNEGELVRSYFNEPVLLTPMQTIDIVIHAKDNKGGTGANFLIEWKKNNDKANAPLIEAIMTSVAGQHNMAFTSRGVILDSPENVQDIQLQEQVIDSTTVYENHD